MSLIFAKYMLLNEEKKINKKDLINEKFECDIFINEQKFPDKISSKLMEINRITYLFKRNYTDLSNMFENCTSLVSIDLSNFTPQNVIDISYMFYNCENLTKINLLNMNTSQVRNMAGVFYNCKSLTHVDISSFNTSFVNNTKSYNRI